MHARYLKQAKLVYGKLQDTGYSNAQKLTFLRRINPYAFEELVLLAFAGKGVPIKRNARYSGDGGIDGIVIIEGEERPVQCKRYRSHVNVRHVEAFAELCHRRGTRGFFVHTGRTGRASYSALGEYRNIEIISGEKLINLLSNNNLS